MLVDSSIFVIIELIVVSAISVGKEVIPSFELSIDPLHDKTAGLCAHTMDHCLGYAVMIPES